jgi:hypothetical protein
LFVTPTSIMHAARFYYFAFTFRFSYGEGRLERSLRAHDLLQS